MVVIDSYRDAVGLLRDNPVLLLYVVGFAFGAAVLTLIPVLGPFLLILLFPGVMGGMYEVVTTTSNGLSPSIQTFVSGARCHYKSLFGTYAFLLLMEFVIAFVFGFGFVAARMASGSSAVTPTMAAMVAVGLACLFAVVVLIQLADVSVVVGECVAVAALKHGIELAARHPISVSMHVMVRYAVVLLLPGLLYGLFLGGVFVTGRSDQIQIAATAVIITPVVLSVQATLATLFYAQQVTFYTTLSGRQKTT